MVTPDTEKQTDMTSLTFRSLLESGAPVFVRNDDERRRALGLAQRILRHHSDCSVVVLANFRNLQYVNHAVIAQLEAMTLCVKTT